MFLSFYSFNDFFNIFLFLSPFYDEVYKFAYEDFIKFERDFIIEVYD